MRFNINIDQRFCLEWGLNFAEGAVFGILYNLSSWADPVVVDGQIFYHASRNKVMDELPMLTDKPDTIYRIFKHLADENRALIQYEKDGRKDLIRLTDRGKKWNSEKNPSLADNSENIPNELGKKSENNSEKNPTDKNTNIITTTSNNTLSSKESAPKAESFEPPTLEEIQKNFSEKLASLPNVKGPEFWAEWETRKFNEYYTSVKWKVGKTKMKDWKKAVSGWIGRGMEHRAYLKPCPNDPNYLLNSNHERQINAGPNLADRQLAAALARSIGGSDKSDKDFF
jgi:hypothetical protein